MLRELVQSTVFVVDVVPVRHDDPEWSITNHARSHRIRVREIFTYLVPEDKATRDLAGRCAEQARRRSAEEIIVDGKTFWQHSFEIELAYEPIGTAEGIALVGDRIHFANAGLRCRSKACGPAYEGDGYLVNPHRPSMAVTAVANLLRAAATGRKDGEAQAWRDYLAAALGSDYEPLLGQSRSQPKSRPAAVTNPGLRVHYFHVHARLPRPVMSCPAAVLVNKIINLYIAPRPDEAATKIVVADPPPAELPGDAVIRPIIWYPFVAEAFAFGAITTADRLRLFGRMGALTGKFLITDSTYWPADSVDETRFLTFAEDIDPYSDIDEKGRQAKYAEFDAGALSPGDYNVRLDPGAIHLYRSGVPFYIGAMPLTQPDQLDEHAVKNLNPASLLSSSAADENAVTTEFCYLEGELDTPIVFDPIINCGGCAM